MNSHIVNHHRPVRYIVWGIGGLALAAAAFFFGFILMLLWNWLMPAIFGLPNITFWQGWGLVLLTHILFKAGPHDHFHGHNSDDFRKKFHERLKKHGPHYPETNTDETSAV
jgi:NADH:ubiquinone oxidoreductase subunit 5 (subunit L)/multisubunit Na+/H+ antiporter MnhA subunit